MSITNKALYESSLRVCACSSSSNGRTKRNMFGQLLF